MSTVVYLKNAMLPQAREVLNTEPNTIHALAPIDWNRPFVAFLDGQPVLRAEWELVLEEGHDLAFIDVNALPQGGGGGSKAVLAVVLIAALTYFSGGMAAGLYSGMGGTFVAANAGMVIAGLQVGIIFAGSALINAMLPPPKATSAQQQAALAAASPTYSLGAQGNSARLESAITEHFGRHIAFPDFGSQPYQEFANNQQYLYQLLVIGRGQYAIESVRIEDSLVGSFEDISYEVKGPGEAVTLFPVNVVSSIEVAGQQLTCYAGAYTAAGFDVVVTAMAHGLATGMTVFIDFLVDSTAGYLAGGEWIEGHSESTGSGDNDYAYWVDGHFNPVYTVPPVVVAADGSYIVTILDADRFSITASSSVNSSGACNISPWIGGFIASAADTLTNYLGFDFICPKGLYYANDDGSLGQVALHVHAQARLVDSATGAPISGVWFDVVSKVYAGATTTPQANSERVQVTQGRYQVRARRVDVEQTSTRYGHSVTWAGLRCYLHDTRTFGDVTVIAMRMKASNNLSAQASRKVNVIATRKLPIWNGSSWSDLTPTTSIAWALAYACKQVGMTDQQIDLATLLTLDSVWAARGDQFNARFDNFLSFWEAVTKIAQAGRTKPFMQGGVIRFKRDQAQTLPVAMFSMRNISKGSFAIDYLMPTNETADAVDVKYFDQSTWAQAKVQAKLPSSLSVKPAKVELFGVTDRNHAHREGMYQAASNRYRRRMVKFGAEMDGFIPSYGDLIAIQHDMPGWGQSGELAAVNTATNLLRYSGQLDNPVWEKSLGAAVTPNAAMAQDGTMTAALVNFSSSASILRQGVPTTAGLTYTLSFWAKSVIGDPGILCDFGDGMSVPAVLSSNLTNFSFTKTATSSPHIDIAMKGAAQIIISGVQLELGSFATPTIKTVDTAVTQQTLTLSEIPEWGEGTHNIALRRRDGTVSGPYTVLPSIYDGHQVIIGASDFVPYIGDSEERTHYAFGWAETYRTRALILSIKPDGIHKVSIEAVVEDDNVHTAESGVIAPPMVTSQLTGYTSKPVVTGLTARFAFNVKNKAVITWNPSPWADHYLVEMSEGNGAWQRVGETGATNFVATAVYGKNTIVRVAAVGMAKGMWSQTTITVVRPFDVISASYTILPTGIKLKWSVWPEVATYEIRVGGDSWETAVNVASLQASEYMWAMQQAGTLVIRIKAVDVNGNYSSTSRDVNVIVPAPSAPAMTYELAGPDEVLRWSIPTSGFLVDRYEIRHGATWALGTLLSTTKSTSHRRKADFGGDRIYWIAAIDVIGNVGAAGTVTIRIASPGSVPNMRVDVIDNNALIYWGTPLTGSLPIDRYEARKGAAWADAVVIGSNGNSTFTTVFEQQSGIYNYWITAVDSAGNFGIPISVQAMINQPPDYVLRASIDSNFEGGNTNSLSYTDKASDVTVFNGLQATRAIGTGYGSVRGVTGLSNVKDYWEVTVLSGADILIGIGKAAANLNIYVGLDENGYGYWSADGTSRYAGATSAPLGEAWGIGDTIGLAVDLTLGANSIVTFFKNGTQQGPSKIVGVGPWFPMLSLPSASANLLCNFGGTKFAYAPPTGYDGRVNVVDDVSSLLLPINTTESWSEHYTVNGFATPDAQVVAGFPIYINPSLTIGSYTEVIDYGSNLPATNVTVLLSSTVISGTVGISCTISYKLLSGDVWIDGPVGATSMLATNFRYIKVAYTFTATAGANLLRANSLSIKLSIKQRGDNGAGIAAIGGTTVNFGYPFLSADTPTVQPNGSVPLIPVVIYAGGVSPTSFIVRLYNLAGTDVGGSFSWTVKGY
jgi:hypothetical protein